MDFALVLASIKQEASVEEVCWVLCSWLRLLTEVYHSFFQQITKSHPLAEPEVIASMVSYFAKPESYFITGKVALTHLRRVSDRIFLSFRSKRLC